ncbi:putative methyltransferase YcgJ [mine drainage metagenome]|uniref:Putative methyltransferase YcgJ n=1 Tax=mine drainage metagenome TaxID=410659 RepID=A0A1J5T121_9ZZZZ
MDDLLAALRAVAEPTRLRLLALCAGGELTVSDLVGLLGQSQPRVSRHLKVMCDGGLLERIPEGAWVLYRAARRGPGGDLARQVLALLPPEDPDLARDHARLLALKVARAEAAAAYFRANAGRWAELRSLYVDEAEVEAMLRAELAARPIGDLLDIGTGTGRLLEVLGPLAERAEGIDASREMLALARANLDRAGLGQCAVRQGDMYALPFADAAFDVAVLHQVLHFADAPAAAVAEAARILRPGGRLALVDFAPHHLEMLRSEHSHRRLGFSDDEVAQWCDHAGLTLVSRRRLPGASLTVVFWLAERRPVLGG